ncbi:MAG: cation:proton antiporter [Candidatus Diapherotrites archaeon]
MRGMAQADFSTVFWQLGLILLAATIMNFFARKAKQPPLVGYIFGGIIIGPYFISFISSSFGLTTSFFPKLDISNVALLSQLGVAFLLFSVGVESNLFKLKNLGTVIIVSGFVQVLLTVAITMLLGLAISGLSFSESLYLGVILSCSSTMLILKLLSDSFSINTIHGRLMLGISLVQDAAIVLMMPLLLKIGFALDGQIIFDVFVFGATLLFLAIALNRFIYPAVFKRLSGNTEVLFLAPISVCFAFMFISETFGMPMAIGAFIAGVSLSALPYSAEVANEIRGLRDFFVTIFFVTLGMQLNIFSLPAATAVIVLAIIVIFLLKPFITYWITMLAGYGNDIAASVAFCLIPVSEYSFLLASQGHSAGALTGDFHSTVIFVIGLSMIVTPYIFKYRRTIESTLQKMPWNRQKFSVFFSRNLESVFEEKELSSKVIIAGGGIMGGSLARFLKSENPIVLDHDPDVISLLKKEGISAVYGEIDNEHLWRKIKIKDTKVVIIAVPSFDSAVKLLKYAKKENPAMVVFARAHSFAEAKELYAENADFVCLPEAAASNIVVKEVMEYLHSGSLTRIRALHSEMMMHIEEAAAKHPKKKTSKKDGLI